MREHKELAEQVAANILGLDKPDKYSDAGRQIAKAIQSSVDKVNKDRDKKLLERSRNPVEIRDASIATIKTLKKLTEAEQMACMAKLLWLREEEKLKAVDKVRLPLEEALEHIIDHYQIVGGNYSEMSTTVKIAKLALAKSKNGEGGLDG